MQWVALAPMALALPAIYMQSRLRERRGAELRQFCNLKQNVMIGNAHEIVQNYRMIKNYNMISARVEEFGALINQYNKASVNSAAYDFTSQQSIPALFAFIGAGFILMGGQAVLYGHMNLGQYLATVSMFAELGNEMLTIYDIVLRIQNADDSLRNITRCMNYATDLEGRRLAHNSTRLKSREALIEAWQRMQDGNPAMKRANFVQDLMTIKLENLTFSYSPTAHVFKNV